MRGTTLAARGWTREGGDLWEVLARLDADGCSRYVVTDVTKDGTLRGPNVDLLREVCARTTAPVVASGGISSLEDLRVLRDLVEAGVEGAIVGKACTRGTSRSRRPSTWRAGPDRSRSPHDRLRRVPWAGRTLQPNAFAGDDGSRSPELAAALDAWRTVGDDPSPASTPNAPSSPRSRAAGCSPRSSPSWGRSGTTAVTRAPTWRWRC